jgi:ribonucleoside-diphosphate reductase alpha chain
MANNSAVYTEKPTLETFLDEWVNLMKAKSGERGIFNRGGLKHQLPARRWNVFKQDVETSGTNPCGEIVLKSKQFCNLSEVVARSDDTEETLMDKVRVATMLGTYQAGLTNFPYLSKEWKKNCDEEALLGVSITGQFDCKALRNPQTLRKLKEVAIETNRKYAAKLGINPSTCVTTVKPSGNGSQLFDSSSGMHPRHAPFYVRRIRIESHNPIFMMLRDMSVPMQPEVGQTADSATTFVVEFPVKAPKGSVYKDDLSAIDQLTYWKMLKENYTEHNPSTTVSISDDEWLQVANWVYENWDMVGGLSFLPRADHVYRLAPYEAITEERYNEMVKDFPQIDFSKIVLYEYDDKTTGSKELACASGTCEIDIVASAPEEQTKS